jgi:hypothetical protein
MKQFTNSFTLTPIPFIKQMYYTEGGIFPNAKSKIASFPVGTKKT